jgi:hypothetical protein
LTDTTNEPSLYPLLPVGAMALGCGKRNGAVDGVTLG